MSQILCWTVWTHLLGFVLFSLVVEGGVGIGNHKILQCYTFPLLWNYKCNPIIGSLPFTTQRKRNNPAGGSRETIIIDLNEGKVEGSSQCLKLFSGQ